jgi:hypothetical protein
MVTIVKQFGFIVLLLPCCCLIFLVSLDQHAKLREAEWQQHWQAIAVPPQGDFTFDSNLQRNRRMELNPPWQRKEDNQSSMLNSTISSPQNARTTLTKRTTINVVKIHGAVPPSFTNQRSSNCTCVDEINSFHCCQRALIGVHKMGFTAVQELSHRLFSSSSDMIATPQIMSDHLFGRWFQKEFQQPTTRDYRHVVVTRNWYDSIISGYLYHKSGKECWLDWFGRPGHDGWLFNNSMEHWEQRLLNHKIIMATQSSHQWPPGKGRDLCQYLAEESEEVGLQVYASWAMACFMYPLLEFRHRRLDMEQQRGWNRTIFVCYEQLMSSTGFASAIPFLHQWFFPHPAHLMLILPHPKKYQGAHATNPDTTIRSRLYATLSRIDWELFHGTIQQGSTEFGCGVAEHVHRPTRPSLSE